MTSSRLLIVALFGSLAALTIGCNQTHDLSAVSKTQLTAAQIAATPVPQPAVAQPPQYVQPAAQQQAAPAAPAVAPPAPRGEQTLDTNVPNPAATPPVANNSTPMFETRNLKSKVRTPQDEHLPKWVPVKGRLTVVDSSDLAENLGLVPKGATKKADERISVADKLAEQDAARTAAKGDSMAQGSSWSYAKAGKVTNRR